MAAWTAEHVSAILRRPNDANGVSPPLQGITGPSGPIGPPGPPGLPVCIWEGCVVPLGSWESQEAGWACALGLSVWRENDGKVTWNSWD